MPAKSWFMHLTRIEALGLHKLISSMASIVEVLVFHPLFRTPYVFAPSVFSHT